MDGHGATITRKMSDSPHANRSEIREVQYEFSGKKDLPGVGEIGNSALNLFVLQKLPDDQGRREKRGFRHVLVKGDRENPAFPVELDL